MDAHDRVSRRSVLRRLAWVPALALGAAACKRELTCSDLSGLSEPERKARVETFGYVEQSPNPQQPCQGCALYKAAPAEDQCGGCTLVKGPIHPKGWCRSWAAKAPT